VTDKRRFPLTRTRQLETQGESRDSLSELRVDL